MGRKYHGVVRVKLCDKLVNEMEGLETLGEHLLLDFIKIWWDLFFQSIFFKYKYNN